jgi:hypothetical protein
VLLLNPEQYDAAAFMHVLTLVSEISTSLGDAAARIGATALWLTSSLKALWILQP